MRVNNGRRREVSAQSYPRVNQRRREVSAQSYPGLRERRGLCAELSPG